MNEKVLAIRKQIEELVELLESSDAPLAFEIIGILEKIALTLSNVYAPDVNLIKEASSVVSKNTLDDYEFSNSELGEKIFELTAKLRAL